MYSGLVILCIFLLQFSDREVSAIDCFLCNSRNNSACLDVDIFLRRDDSPELLYRHGLHLINCEHAIPVLPQKIIPNFFCRKMVQTILRHGHESEVRVTRGCGWVPHHRPCYTAHNEGHLETVCQCFEDGCNGSGILRGSILGIFSLTAAYIGRLFV